MPIKKIKPLRSKCPRCSNENTTTMLNFEGYSNGTWLTHQSHVDCGYCGYGYTLMKHLVNPEDKIEILEGV